MCEMHALIARKNDEIQQMMTLDSLCGLKFGAIDRTYSGVDAETGGMTVEES